MTKPRILPDLQAQAALIAKLQSENDALRAKASGIKLSSKGGVSVYGLGKWPVTLYKSQWDKLLGMVPDIQAFITANESVLSVKATKSVD